MKNAKEKKKTGKHTRQVILDVGLPDRLIVRMKLRMSYSVLRGQKVS